MRVAKSRIFQSTHPSRGATVGKSGSGTNSQISIHAPLTGCDAYRPDMRRTNQHFNPRTPHGVRLFGTENISQTRIISIHAPLTGCDRESCEKTKQMFDFNPRTPHGVRLRQDGVKNSPRRISIHAPLTGCDVKVKLVGVRVWISIHAPLTGCDGSPLATRSNAFLFQSTHPSRGATIHNAAPVSGTFEFQSTHPSRGATLAPKT